MDLPEPESPLTMINFMQVSLDKVLLFFQKPLVGINALFVKYMIFYRNFGDKSKISVFRGNDFDLGEGSSKYEKAVMDGIQTGFAWREFRDQPDNDI